MFKIMIKPTIILGIVALVSSIVLSQLQTVTKKPIEDQKKAKKERALRMVLPGFKIDSNKDKQTVTLGKKKKFVFWSVIKEITDKKTRQKKKVKAYAFEASLPGYSGDVKSMVGVDENGTVLGISILQQTETPGLGARCVEIASKNTFFGTITGNTVKEDSKPKPWFEKQFKGIELLKKVKILKTGKDWEPSMRKSLLEKNAVSAITGATITTVTVRDSLKKGYEKLKKALVMKSKEKSK